MLDGEIVIARNEGLDFETLQLRLHPAESRVKKLAVETPASVVFFDLLCENDRSLCDRPFGERRARWPTLHSPGRGFQLSCCGVSALASAVARSSAALSSEIRRRHQRGDGLSSCVVTWHNKLVNAPSGNSWQYDAMLNCDHTVKFDWRPQ